MEAAIEYRKCKRFDHNSTILLNEFCGIVKWCKDTGDEEGADYPYGVGVEFC